MMLMKSARFFPRPCRPGFSFLPLLPVLLAVLLAPAPLFAARGPGNRLHIPVTVIPGLTAEIRSLRFYATDYGQQDFRRRKYATTFPAPGIKYLNWELILDHPFEREEPILFRIKAVLTGPDGKTADTSETLAWIEPDADWTQWGKAFRVAAWKPGTYKVAIIIGKKELLKTSFQVVQEGKAPVGPADSLAALQPRVKSLRFYAGGSKPTPYYRVKFATEFKNQDTRQIWWILDLDLLGQRSGSVTIPLEEIWYGPDQRIIHQASREFSVPPHRKTWWFGARHGFNDRGRWQPGSYRLVLKVQGKTLASASFKVEGQGVAPPAGDFLKQHNLKVESLKFFEGPAPAPKFEDRRYHGKFPQASTRYIYWELDLEAPGPRPAAVTFMIKSFWYDAAGNLIKEASENFTLKKTYKRPWFTHGYGYSIPGLWKPGKYRVVLKIDDKEVASGAFEIMAAKAAAPTVDFLRQHHLKFGSLKFFEGPEKPPAFGSRSYQAKFPQVSTRYLHWELILESTGKRTAQVPLAIESSLYGPQGYLLKKRTFDFTLRADYKRPAFAANFYGSLLPGRWRPGKYRVVLKIKGQEVASGSFEITTGPKIPGKK